jgi:phosphopantetheine adenylyltransferase
MQIKLTVYADAEKTINVDNESWNKMDESEQAAYIYKNFLDNFIDNSVQSDYEVIEKYTDDEFVSKVNDEYDFAKKQNFDSIVITIETSGGDYEISEFENGFNNDNLDGVYSTLDEIAYDLKSLIEMNGDIIEGFRIE